jgi:hypothetical protein
MKRVDLSLLRQPPARQALEALRLLIDSQIELEPWRVKKQSGTQQPTLSL